jgi:hypothetical protein
MLRSLLRIATAQREAFVTSLIAEADILGPMIVDAARQITRFGKQEEARNARIQKAYAPWIAKATSASAEAAE